MDLQYFPMDRQLCFIEIESCEYDIGITAPIKRVKSLITHFSRLTAVGYTMSDIRYKWNDGLNSVQISADVSLPQFKVLGHRQKAIEASLSTGNCV